MQAIWWLGWAFVVIGCGFMWREHRIILADEIVRGQVVELVASAGSKGGTVYAPKVSFETRQGQQITFKSSLSSNRPGLSVGDSVYMAYDPQDPQNARLMRFGYRFGFWYCLVGLGLLLLFTQFGFTYGTQWMQEAYLSRVR